MACIPWLFARRLSSSFSEGARRCPRRQVQVCAVTLEVQRDAGLNFPNRQVVAVRLVMGGLSSSGGAAAVAPRGL